MTRAYESWDFFDKQHFNSDGTMTEEYRNRLLEEGKSLFDTLAMEAEVMEQVKEFEAREERYLQEFGETWSEMNQRRSLNLTPAQQKAKQQAALEEGADLSELPYDMEQDDYYNYYAEYPG